MDEDKDIGQKDITPQAEVLKRRVKLLVNVYNSILSDITNTREFDPGSGRTLAACLTHASRAGSF